MKNALTLLALMLTLPVLAHAASPLTPGFAGLEQLPATGTLVLPLSDPETLPQSLESSLNSSIAKAIQVAEFKAKKDDSLVLNSHAGYARVILVGTGSDGPLGTAELKELGGNIAQLAGAQGGEQVSILWSGIEARPADAAAHIGLGLQLGAYRFHKYKTTDTKAKSPSEFTLYTESPQTAAQTWQSQLAGVADGVYFARDLISEPANVIYPESFVERTRAAYKGSKNVSIDVLDVRDMEKLGMGALLGVGMGSERPPRLLVINYRGADKDSAPIAFVGKGVTFDSGGISIKGGKGMWRMKYDMSGAAAVSGTVLALAKRQAPVNAIAIAALVENMPSQKAQRPGDVRTTMSGKTVEVINTDAEGRLILADAVWYAQQKFKPQALVDVATLTGSIKVALGEVYGGVFSRSDEFAAQLIAAGRESGEEVWRMPLHPLFVKAIKSDIADVKNSVEGGFGGASTGAEFIGTFIEESTTWAHLDIAGKAWGFSTTATAPKGAVGWGVQLLNQLVVDHYQAGAQQ